MPDVEWTKDLAPEDLPEPYQEISRMIGLESTLKIADKFQGSTLYLPKMDTVLRKMRDERIKAEFNGTNHRLLARKYGLTEAWIRQILAERGPDQLSFVDFLDK